MKNLLKGGQRGAQGPNQGHENMRQYLSFLSPSFALSFSFFLAFTSSHDWQFCLCLSYNCKIFLLLLRKHSRCMYAKTRIWHVLAHKFVRSKNFVSLYHTSRIVRCQYTFSWEIVGIFSLILQPTTIFFMQNFRDLVFAPLAVATTENRVTNYEKTFSL